jgi:hypothetical protein
MGFTNQTCEESGVWAGRCGHAKIVVTKGDRFPECSGCRRGIDWHHVGSVGDALRDDPRAKFADSADDGWWPGKDSSSTTSS